MLRNLYSFVLLTQFPSSECLVPESWGYNSIHCRDNADKPVDWWFILKPPRSAESYLDSGRNFSFVTSGSFGKWKESSIYITGTSMLQHTLLPAYKSTYWHHAAVAAYNDRRPTAEARGSLARGLLLVDVLGGLWLGHTVPGLLDMNKSRPEFPPEEIENGHLLMCISIGLHTANLIAESLNHVAPNFTYVRVPEKLERLLPEWKFSWQPTTLNRKLFRYIEFPTESGTKASLLVRTPGEERCIYMKFAKLKRIVLDVYGHPKNEKLDAICEKQFSVRHINKISLKHPENIQYINRNKDQVRFAVSTAAHWQRQGGKVGQHWTCISNLDKGDNDGYGGLLMCVDDYQVWVNFDTLKINEPQC